MGNELGPSIGDNILRDTEIPEDMVKQAFCVHHGSWDALHVDQPTGVGKQINGDEDASVALRVREIVMKLTPMCDQGLRGTGKGTNFSR